MESVVCLLVSEKEEKQANTNEWIKARIAFEGRFKKGVVIFMCVLRRLTIIKHTEKACIARSQHAFLH